MELDDKARSFIQKAKEAGKTKEEVNQFLIDKGYDTGISNIQPKTTKTSVEEGSPQPWSKQHPYQNIALEALPVAGAIGGGIAGAPFGGVGSIPGAAFGGAAGEGLKQRIRQGMGIQEEFNPQAVQNAAIGGLAGEGIGILGGKAFTMAAPKVGKFMARIPENDYVRALESKGSVLFSNQKKAGEGVNIAKKELEKLPPMSFDELINILESTKNKYAGGGINLAANKVNPLLKRTEDALVDAGIAQELIGKTGVSPRAVHEIKDMLQQASKYTNIKGEPIYRGQSGELIKNLASQYNSLLRKTSPGYKAANESFQDALAAKQFKSLGHVSPFSLQRMLPFAFYHSPSLVGGLEATTVPYAHGVAVDAYKLLRGSGLGGGIGVGTNR